MTQPSLSSGFRISAVVSDVDGTLLDREKRLTDGTRAAIAELRKRGIAFVLISSRPPRGLRMLLEPLTITTPVAGFNGGAVTTPELAIIEQHLLSPSVARHATDFLTTRGLEVWVFSKNEWLLRALNGPRTNTEKRAVQFMPTLVKDFGNALDAANKIVGVSNDYDLIRKSEHEARGLFADRASVARSQQYYLDFTHLLANKGAAVQAISRLLAIPMEQVAVIGDGVNDVAMFEQSPFSIAMGNASSEVRDRARFVTTSNDDEGFASAIERYVIRPDVTSHSRLGTSIREQQ